jgi:hypothetical protein
VSREAVGRIGLSENLKINAVVGQRVARLPFLAGDGGASPTPRLHFTTATVAECAPLLASEHYLGPIGAGRCAFAGWVDDVLVACQVYKWPTARLLPSDGTWLELSRWCLTPDAGKNAGSRMMAWVARQLRRAYPNVTTLVSYSDPVHGHTGALYRASGWVESPTHYTLRYRANGVGYPSGAGSWNGRDIASPKERWVFELKASA